MNTQSQKPMKRLNPLLGCRRQGSGCATRLDAAHRGVHRTAIVGHARLMPGTKLAEQKIADIFDVSRTIVRQALNQLSREHLVSSGPARGASVAMPSIEEARQVFEVHSHDRSGDGAPAPRTNHRCTNRATARPPAQRTGSRQAHRCVGPRSCWPTFTSCSRACWAMRCWRSCWPTCSAAHR